MGLFVLDHFTGALAPGRIRTLSEAIPMLHSARVRRAAERARLAARISVVTNDYGDLISGSIDPEMNAIHEHIMLLEDQLLDGLPANPLQIQWFEHIEAQLLALAPHLRQLELQIYAAA